VEADLRGWFPLLGIVLPEDRISSILDRAEREVGALVKADGDGLAFPVRALIATGVRPGTGGRQGR